MANLTSTAFSEYSAASPNSVCWKWCWVYNTREPAWLLQWQITYKSPGCVLDAFGEHWELLEKSISITISAKVMDRASCGGSIESHSFWKQPKYSKCQYVALMWSSTLKQNAELSSHQCCAIKNLYITTWLYVELISAMKSMMALQMAISDMKHLRFK